MKEASHCAELEFPPGRNALYNSAMASPDLTEADAAAELERLAREIAEHDRRYYAEQAPSLSDAEYDALKHRNAELEARFPALVRPGLAVAAGRRAAVGHLHAGAPRRADGLAQRRLLR